jgi:hypothetical protein
LRQLRAADRHSCEITDRWDPIFCSARACNLHLKSVMRSVPVLGDELKVRADGTHYRCDVWIGYSEITSQPYANHCAVGTYRHEDCNVLVNFVGGLDCMETGRLAFDFRAQNAVSIRLLSAGRSCKSDCASGLCSRPARSANDCCA